MDIPQLNPYGLEEGQGCDAIRIRYQPIDDTPMQEVIVSLPPQVAPDSWEGAATAAYLIAKEQGLLSASLMVVCQFFYLDDEVGGWVEFEPADC
jgi:hypothetical protein